MALRLRHKVFVRISEDTAETKTRFGPSSDTVSGVVIDVWTKQLGGNADIAAAATKALSLGDLTNVRGLLLEASGDCQLTLNGGTPLLLRKASGASVAKFFMEGEITSISITALASAAVSVVYCIWGDAAA